MKDVDVIPAIIFGAILGALVALVAGTHRPSLVDLAPGLIASATTIVVGWWIQKAVRRRGELDRVPIEYLSRLNQRIDRLISACLDNPKVIANFAQLSNEIHWQTALLRKMRPDVKPPGEEIASLYVQFKRHLTDSEPPDIMSASRTSHEMRLTALSIQWHLCRHVLDRPGDVEVLMSR